MLLFPRKLLSIPTLLLLTSLQTNRQLRLLRNSLQDDTISLSQLSQLRDLLLGNIHTILELQLETQANILEPDRRIPINPHCALEAKVSLSLDNPTRNRDGHSSRDGFQRDARAS